jgi:predicted AAA+ superfamily ATPase
LVKTPKLYFYDSGLVCWLLGLRAIEIKAGATVKPIAQRLARVQLENAGAQGQLICLSVSCL